MGLFSRPKCPIHKKEYSIGTNGLEDYYYCKECKAEAIRRRDEKKQHDKEMQELKDRIAALEREKSST